MSPFYPSSSRKSPCPTLITGTRARNDESTKMSSNNLCSFSPIAGVAACATLVVLLVGMGCTRTDGGCGMDSDCKGERVCENRICVTDQREAASQQPLVADSKDRLIEPGVRVGAITRETSEDDLKLIYGARNVARESWYIGEGQYRKATVLFKGTHDEIWVLWQGDDYGVVERVALQGTGWRTSEGLRVATPIGALNEMNGRAFDFYGWEWDYGGTVKDWNGGALSRFDDKLIVRLTRNFDTNWGKSFEDAVVGDQTVRSDLDGLEAIETKVSVMEAEL